MGRNVLLLEATDRYGGRIETGDLSPPPIAGDAPHKAEFGPMRFELEIQPLFAQLLDDFKIATEPFSAPSSPEPPVEYPLAQDERAADGTPLSSLALLKLGVFRMVRPGPLRREGQRRETDCRATKGRPGLARRSLRRGRRLRSAETGRTHAGHAAAPLSAWPLECPLHATQPDGRCEDPSLRDLLPLDARQSERRRMGDLLASTVPARRQEAQHHPYWRPDSERRAPAPTRRDGLGGAPARLSGRRRAARRGWPRC